MGEAVGLGTVRPRSLALHSGRLRGARGLPLQARRAHGRGEELAQACTIMLNAGHVQVWPHSEKVGQRRALGKLGEEAVQRQMAAWAEIAKAGLEAEFPDGRLGRLAPSGGAVVWASSTAVLEQRFSVADGLLWP